MMRCKRCGSEKHTFAGKVRGKQRYKCASCAHHFVEGDTRKILQEAQHLQAVSLCASGLSMNHVGKLFDVSATAVQRWIKTYVPRLCPKPQPAEGERILILELDEMWHYLKKNPIKSGYGRLIVVTQVDSSIGNVGIVMP